MKLCTVNSFSSLCWCIESLNCPAKPRQSNVWLSRGKFFWDFLKVHMHEIFIVCFLTFFCIFHSLIDTKRSTANIFEKFIKFTQIFKVFDNSPFSPKARSMAERCRRKRDVKLSAVFITVRFRIVLSVFGEKAESHFAFSAKAPS